MCQSVVNKYIAREWKYLGLVLQPAEWGGENKPVVIPLELRTVMRLKEGGG